MIATLGQGMILVALVCALSGSILAFISGRRRSASGVRLARRAAITFALLLIGANLLMVYALLVPDFSVSYVAKVGSTQVPTWVAIVSLWSSLEGSILFWGAMLGVYVLGSVYDLGDEHPEHLPYFLGVLLACGVFFSFLLAGPANPFLAVPNPLSEGPGPNPLLQNHILMIIHPPMLYAGYVGMTVPFSLAMSALFAGNLGADFVPRLRRWLLIPWIFLTAGVVLGGWWAYEVLGWGGYWDWDPVENASFFPWLTATAALHSVVVVGRRGALKVWTVTLVLATFLLTILGTFMTRSGVFNSVHSFTQSDIGPTFLIFLAICFIVVIVTLAARMDKLAQRNKIRDLKSREAMFLLNNLFFVLFTFTVVIGTVFPLLVEAVKGVKISVGSPYFNAMSVPLGVGILFLMGVGPALPWGAASWPRLRKALLPPLIGSFAALAIALPLGLRNGWALATCFAAGYTLVVTAQQFGLGFAHRGLGGTLKHLFGADRTRFGAYVVHAGVIAIIVAIAISHTMRTQLETSLLQGESASIGAYTLTFTGIETHEQPHRRVLAARLAVTEDGASLGELKPAMNHYRSQREPIGTPAVRTGLISDLYLSMMSYDPKVKRLGLRAYINPAVSWIWIGTLVMVFGGLLAVLPKKRSS
jgi:cytochrome c-type biogenesis protein CcmF